MQSKTLLLLKVFLLQVLVGLPGTAGFVAEFLLIFSLWKAFGLLVAAVAGTTVILSAAYTLRLVQKLLFGKCAEKDPAPAVFPAAAAWAVVPLLLALVFYGFQPGAILKAARADLLTRLPSAQALIVEDAPHVAGR